MEQRVRRPVDINAFRIGYTDWNDLQAKGVIYANATWPAAIYGEGMVGEPLQQTQPVRLGHSAACFKPAYEAAAERYKQQNGFDHRHLPPASAGAADQVVRAIAATMLADGAVSCQC